MQAVPFNFVKRPRVLLADDHTLVIEGLRRVLEADCEIVGAVSDGRALLEATERIHPDIIVADISMPLLNGIEAIRQIRKTERNVPVVFLTMHADATYAAKAFAAGGSAFVLKSSAGDELLTAMHEAMRGRRYVTPALSSQVLQDQAKLPDSRPRKSAEALTTRQQEVLQLVAEGKTLKEIAEVLHVSSRTVEFHKYRIMALLGLHTTGELTRYAVKHGIVDA
jgi:DNA-binding NarL/FixJ family response regulator